MKEDDGRDGGSFASAGSQYGTDAANVEHITGRPASTHLQVRIPSLCIGKQADKQNASSSSGSVGARGAMLAVCNRALHTAFLPHPIIP